MSYSLLDSKVLVCTVSRNCWCISSEYPLTLRRATVPSRMAASMNKLLLISSAIVTNTTAEPYQIRLIGIVTLMVTTP